MLRMLHAFPDELHPEAAPSVLRDHEHVAQPRMLEPSEITRANPTCSWPW